MRISVVIPVLNGAAFLAQAIRSARDQSLPPVEIIVADNGSTDASVDIARSFGPPVQVISVAEPGATAARAAGFAESSGEALMFLDADDLLGLDTLAHLADALKGQGPAMSCCPWRRYELEGECWRARPASCAVRQPWHDDLAAWLTGWYHPPCSVLWSREAYETSGGWDPLAASNQDGDLMMRALVAGAPLIRAKGGMGYYRRLPGGQTSLSGQRASPKGLAARLRVLEKIETLLRTAGRQGRYATPLAEAYATIAGMCGPDVPQDLADRARGGCARNGGFGRLRRTRRSIGKSLRRSIPARTVQMPVQPIEATAAPAQDATPLVSVVLPTYNRAATLGRAVDSVLAQSYSHLELLLVDDGSTDGTAEYAASLSDSRLRYLRQAQNRGVAAARNRGLAAARGQLIAFIDSDDAWMPEKLARQVAQMQAAPGRIGLIYSGLRVEHADRDNETWRPQARGHVLADILQRNVLHFGTSSTMIRAEAAAVVGGFDSSFPANEDHDYWARMARFYEFEFDPAPLVIYDQGGGTAGAEAKRSAQFARNMRARNMFIEKHGFEAAHLRALHAYQLESARRFLEWQQGGTRHGRRLLLKAALAAPARPQPYAWLALSLLPEDARASAVRHLRRIWNKSRPERLPSTK
ncbi:MAG: glycosyltransferase [Pseudomonadota bacterium]|nr:glycosyltransferase [Pseudomonadota bacterium]